MVQKAVVVLATEPIFGPLREKLGMVTRAYFAQRDLNNVALLEEFYDTLEPMVRQASSKDVQNEATSSDGAFIFKQQRAHKPDVIVDQLEHTQLHFTDPTLSSAVSLTPADRSWMDQIIHVVQETWKDGDPSQPIMMQYEGSDDYLRARFEESFPAKQR
ncbi:hypothetical protein MBRA1_001727 [Malassezia brasiliensis]|uniref:AVL9/DENND6 domain-containing protein n=1 Tax=Malassezia brasiliensis TaxID=1821822 RepID=A0AAF0IPL9_9BASI|nr:hypothetical protein MBRA1_001727 [Malassezia brasiliensis]